MLKAPVAVVTAVSVGAAGRPHAIKVFDSEVRHVAEAGSAPTITLRPESAAPEFKSSTVPLMEIVGAADDVGVAVGVAEAAVLGEPVAVELGAAIVPPPLLPDDPPPPQAAARDTRANAIKRRRIRADSARRGRVSVMAGRIGAEREQGHAFGGDKRR